MRTVADDDPDAVARHLRGVAPHVLTALLRRYGHFDDCEDAVAEAMLTAVARWPSDGVPDDPKAWLVTVASRRLVDQWRRDTARTAREKRAGRQDPRPDLGAPLDDGTAADEDDTLALLLLCCHPALTRPAQMALTLRAVGGLTTAEIARGLLVPEATVAQRISRAKRRIADAGPGFPAPTPDQLETRLATVRDVLYLVFTEGSTASAGQSVSRVELSSEAIRLMRRLHADQADDGETAGLLALMLLTDARRPARTTAAGDLVPITEQDRSRWDRAAIAEGVELVTAALSTTAVGPFQLQAAIAAVHDEAATAADTDWREILGLYDLLTLVAPGPMVTLNRVVALAMTRGPEAGLVALDRAVTDPALVGHYRVDAVRGHLLELSGDREAAREHYRRAARGTLSLPEQRYLVSRAEREKGVGK